MDEHCCADLMVGRRGRGAGGVRRTRLPWAEGDAVPVVPIVSSDSTAVSSRETVAQRIERRKTPLPFSSASRVAGGGLSTDNREVAGSSPASLTRFHTWLPNVARADRQGREGRRGREGLPLGQHRTIDVIRCPDVIPSGSEGSRVQTSGLATTDACKIPR